MLIEVSHESPISILEHSSTYNDYGYALVHLFETHPEYYDYYNNLSKNTNVPVLLDNSIFELKKAFDSKKFAGWVDKLQPSYYIVPDVLEDGFNTRKMWVEFNNKYRPDCNAAQIGVVQGIDWTDLVECYKFMASEADFLAISFDYEYYQHTGYGNTKLERMCSGRKQFIRRLIDEGIWCWSKPHHLLGCSLAKEFRYYVDTNIFNIKSCDTSNPVVAAIKGIRYNDDMGLTEKPSTLLADLIEYDLSDDQLEDLEYNTSMFKKILKR